MKKKRNLENTLFSFLDVISCGFGAIVMLVLIYKFNPSENIEDLEKLNLNDLVIKLKDWRLQKKFHIHKEFGEVLLNDGVQYICNHD